MAQLIDLLGVPSTKKQKVQICGVEFALQDFPLLYHGMWSTRFREMGLEQLQNEMLYRVLPTVAVADETNARDPELLVINNRIEKLEGRIAELMDAYASDDEPEDIDQQLDELTRRLHSLSRQRIELSQPRLDSTTNSAIEAQTDIMKFRELQDEARLAFAHDVASMHGYNEKTFEEWKAMALAKDYDNVEKWVDRGNAPWVERLSKTIKRGLETQTKIGTSSSASSSRRGGVSKKQVN